MKTITTILAILLFSVNLMATQEITGAISGNKKETNGTVLYNNQYAYGSFGGEITGKFDAVDGNYFYMMKKEFTIKFGEKVKTKAFVVAEKNILGHSQYFGIGAEYMVRTSDKVLITSETSLLYKDSSLDVQTGVSYSFITEGFEAGAKTLYLIRDNILNTELFADMEIKENLTLKATYKDSRSGNLVVPFYTVGFGSKF